MILTPLGNRTLLCRGDPIPDIKCVAIGTEATLKVNNAVSPFVYSFYQGSDVGEVHSKKGYSVNLTEKCSTSTRGEFEFHLTLTFLQSSGIQESFIVSCWNHLTTSRKSYEMSPLTPGN